MQRKAGFRDLACAHVLVPPLVLGLLDASLHLPVGIARTKGLMQIVWHTCGQRRTSVLWPLYSLVASPRLSWNRLPFSSLSSLVVRVYWGSRPSMSRLLRCPCRLDKNRHSVTLALVDELPCNFDCSITDCLVVLARERSSTGTST